MKTSRKTSIPYPRKVFIRGSLRLLARGLFPLLTRPRIRGMEKFPGKGPLIVIGNHTGAMEVVLMTVYSPRLVEFIGQSEFPWQGWMGRIINLYGYIPLQRGYTNLETLKMGAAVLRQGGVLGIFPEGGFWEPGRQKAQPGVAWLSTITGAPVLPIGFGDTRGKLGQIFRLKRPVFEMNVGEAIPPVRLDDGVKKKDALQQAAERLMDAVWALVPQDERKRKERRPEEEVFTLHIELFDREGRSVPIPGELRMTDGSWISRFSHRPNLIGTMRDEAHLPVQVFKELEGNPPAEELARAAQSMVDYVERENPQYFNYRYGYQDGEAFLNAFRELHRLMAWAVENSYQVEAEVRYEYRDTESGERFVRQVPEESEKW